MTFANDRHPGAHQALSFHTGMMSENNDIPDPYQPQNGRMIENNDNLGPDQSHVSNALLPWTYNSKPIVPYTDNEPRDASQIGGRVLGHALNSRGQVVRWILGAVKQDKKLRREIVPRPLDQAMGLQPRARNSRNCSHTCSSAPPTPSPAALARTHRRLAPCE